MNVERLRRMCSERNETLAHVEKETGISNGSIRRWDKHSPNVDTAKLVADYLGVSVDFLIRNEP